MSVSYSFRCLGKVPARTALRPLYGHGQLRILPQLGSQQESGQCHDHQCRSQVLLEPYAVREFAHGSRRRRCPHLEYWNLHTLILQCRPTQSMDVWSSEGYVWAEFDGSNIGAGKGLLFGAQRSHEWTGLVCCVSKIKGDMGYSRYRSYLPAFVCSYLTQ